MVFMVCSVCASTVASYPVCVNRQDGRATVSVQFGMTAAMAQIEAVRYTGTNGAVITVRAWL